MELYLIIHTYLIKIINYNYKIEILFYNCKSINIKKCLTGVVITYKLKEPKKN